MTILTELLTDNDDRKAYRFTKEIASESEFSDRYYSDLPEFASLLGSDKSYVRTRAFILCCSQSKWDTEGKLRDIFPQMLQLLHDEKPTVVRQCLSALKEVAVYRNELCGLIMNELDRIELSKYKDSVAPLIMKDIAELKGIISEVSE